MGTGIARTLAALVLATTAGVVSAASATCATAGSLASATRTVGNAPAPLAGPSAVSLPDWLPLSIRSERQRIHYELDVSRCAGSPAPALWLFRVGAPYRVTADGQPLTLLTGRPMLRLDASVFAAQTHVYNGRIPALFELPAGTRRVSVELQTLPYIPAGIVEARMGPAKALLPLQAAAVEDVVAYADAASAVVLVLGLLALLLWVQRRADWGLLWLAAACGLWGLRGLAYFNHAVYLSPAAFEQFNPLNVLLASAALAASTGHVLGGMSRRQSLGLWLVTGACVATLAISGVAGAGAAAARMLSLSAAFGMIVWLVRQAWMRRRDLPRGHAMTLITVFLALLGCAVHDLMVVAGVLPPAEPSYVFWGFVFLLTGFAALSGQSVAMTLNRAERSNEELERHVTHKTRELENSYALLRESERETARAQERGRLLRDMHDGLGAQLMTTLRGVERGALSPAELARSLQDGLDELRLLMDSTDMGHYLPSALAAWRNRWDARLVAAGIALSWTVDESVDSVQLNSDTALQIMRVLQEAAANVIKHAQATHMGLDARVEETPDGPVLRIAITDDGVGFEGDHASRPGARGLKNMQYRARQIGAEILVGRTDSRGARVLLRVPLGAAQDTKPRLEASIAASARDEIPSLR